MEEYELEHTGCARQEAVLVRGGNRLCGELTVQGAKNSTLPLLAAALLCEGETVLHNCPALSDVHTAVTILFSPNSRLAMIFLVSFIPRLPLLFHQSEK